MNGGELVQVDVVVPAGVQGGVARLRQQMLELLATGVPPDGLAKGKQAPQRLLLGNAEAAVIGQVEHQPAAAPAGEGPGAERRLVPEARPGEVPHLQRGAPGSVATKGGSRWAAVSMRACQAPRRR